MDKLNLKKQEPNYLKLKRLVTIIVFGIIVIAVTVALLFSPAQYWKILIIDGVIGLFCLGIVWYQTAAFKRFSYAMNDYGLYINRGVIWQKKIIVPRNRVQHTDVSQGPFQLVYLKK